MPLCLIRKPVLCTVPFLVLCAHRLVLVMPARFPQSGDCPFVVNNVPCGMIFEFVDI